MNNKNKIQNAGPNFKGEEEIDDEDFDADFPEESVEENEAIVMSGGRGSKGKIAVVTEVPEYNDARREPISQINKNGESSYTEEDYDNG